MFVNMQGLLNYADLFNCMNNLVSKNKNDGIHRVTLKVDYIDTTAILFAVNLELLCK
jgi:hypothetical protein